MVLVIPAYKRPWHRARPATVLRFAAPARV